MNKNQKRFWQSFFLVHNGRLNTWNNYAKKRNWWKRNNWPRVSGVFFGRTCVLETMTGNRPGTKYHPYYCYYTSAAVFSASRFTRYLLRLLLLYLWLRFVFFFYVMTIVSTSCKHTVALSCTVRCCTRTFRVDATTLLHRRANVDYAISSRSPSAVNWMSVDSTHGRARRTPTTAIAV